MQFLSKASGKLEDRQLERGRNAEAGGSETFESQPEDVNGMSAGEGE